MSLYLVIFVSALYCAEIETGYGYSSNMKLKIQPFCVKGQTKMLENCPFCVYLDAELQIQEILTHRKARINKLRIFIICKIVYKVFKNIWDKINTIRPLYKAIIISTALNTKEQIFVEKMAQTSSVVIWNWSYHPIIGWVFFPIVTRINYD